MAVTKTEQMFSAECPYANLNQTNAKRLLFVCSVGMLRSPTAQMVATGMGYNARACGSCENIALIPLSCNLINWADKIIFMSRENFDQAMKNFTAVDYHTAIEEKAIVWQIPDQYEWGDNTLWNILHNYMTALTFEDRK